MTRRSSSCLAYMHYSVPRRARQTTADLKRNLLGGFSSHCVSFCDFKALLGSAHLVEAFAIHGSSVFTLRLYTFNLLLLLLPVRGSRWIVVQPRCQFIMSFGFSICDITTIVASAWTTYQGACRACGEHDEPMSEISSLHGVLSHLQAEVSNPKSLVNTGAMNRRLELENHVRGCEHHLQRISSVLVKFSALTEEERRDRSLWQKVRFGNGSIKDIAQIRTKLTTYTTAISMSLQILSLGSQGRIERKLDRQSGEMQGLTERIDLLVAK